MDNLCTNCGASQITKGDTDNGLCDSCQDVLEVYWNYDWNEFVPKYRICPICTEDEVWCNICEMYSCYGCSEYGNCQCS